MGKSRSKEQQRFGEQQQRLAMGRTAEHDQAADRRTTDEQRDKPQRLERAPPLAFGETDAHPGRVAAHERHEQAAEMQETDAVDVAGQRAERTGEQDVGAGIEHASCILPARR
jgi:hypothetical protein